MAINIENISSEQYQERSSFHERNSPYLSDLNPLNSESELSNLIGKEVVINLNALPLSSREDFIKLTKIDNLETYIISTAWYHNKEIALELLDYDEINNRIIINRRLYLNRKLVKILNHK